MGGGLYRQVFIIIMKILFGHKFEEIIGVDNLLEAWREFIKGKRGKKDVQEFGLKLMDNVFDLRCHDFFNLPQRRRSI